MRRIFLILLLLVVSACAQDKSIFPDVPLTTTTSSLALPNPLGLVADTGNHQLIVSNSNVDFSYSQGSVALLNVSATDLDKLEVTATKLIATPNYAGLPCFDGTTLTLPFRDGGTTSNEDDQVRQYTIGKGTITSANKGVTGQDPFGCALVGTDPLIVSNSELDLFSADVQTLTRIDLTIPATSSITLAYPDNAEDVAYDPTSNRAFISNRNGKILVVDLATNTLTHVISSPINTRRIILSNSLLYVLDGASPALWILDPSLLPAATTTVAEVDDAKLVVDVISLGFDPNGLAIDSTNFRAYVTNAFDASLSVIDLKARQEIAKISLKKDDTNLDDVIDPLGVTVGDYDGHSLIFVAGFSSKNIAILSAENLKLLKVFP